MFRHCFKCKLVLIHVWIYKIVFLFLGASLVKIENNIFMACVCVFK